MVNSDTSRLVRLETQLSMYMEQSKNDARASQEDRNEMKKDIKTIAESVLTVKNSVSAFENRVSGGWLVMVSAGGILAVLGGFVSWALQALHILPKAGG